MEGSPPAASPVARVTTPFMLLGIILIALGALSIYAPQQSGMTIGVIVGIFLTISGIFRSSLFWIAPSWGSAILRLLFGLLAVAAGLIMITNPATGLKVITIVAIIYLIGDGISQIVFAAGIPPGAGGAWIMIGGIASVVLGILIWRGWPYSGANAIGILIGLKLIMDGFTLLATASAARAVGRAVSRA